VQTKLNMTKEAEESWTIRMNDLITKLNFDEELFFEYLSEDWTVSEYMDAVAGLGEGGPVGELAEGWGRAEYVNSLIIDFLKNGKRTEL